MVDQSLRHDFVIHLKKVNAAVLSKRGYFLAFLLFLLHTLLAKKRGVGAHSCLIEHTVFFSFLISECRNKVCAFFLPLVAQGRFFVLFPAATPSFASFFPFVFHSG